VEPLEFLVQAAGRPEVGQTKGAAGILDAVAQHIKGATTADLTREPPAESLLHFRPVVLPELLPFLGLGGEQEIQNVTLE
jgi:hypothetical protein